jgi:hypothetical protein
MNNAAINPRPPATASGGHAMALIKSPPRLQQSAAAMSCPTARVWAGDFKGTAFLREPAVARTRKMALK